MRRTSFWIGIIVFLIAGCSNTVVLTEKGSDQEPTEFVQTEIKSTEDEASSNDEQIEEDDQFFDPFEIGNRLALDLFFVTYYVTIHPLVGIYNGVMPQVIKDRVDDFAGFVRAPVTLVNDVLQGNFDGGVQSTIERNTKSLPTLGLYDFDRNLAPRRYEDYGQTLGVYGIPEGPFVMFPLAPSVRDVGAYTAQSLFLDPLLWFLDTPIRLSFLGVRLVSLFSNIDRGLVSLYSSVDAYALVRYGLLQQRRGAILDRGQRKELEERQDDFELEIDEELLEDVYGE